MLGTRLAVVALTIGYRAQRTQQPNYSILPQERTGPRDAGGSSTLSWTWFRAHRSSCIVSQQSCRSRTTGHGSVGIVSHGGGTRGDCKGTAPHPRAEVGAFNVEAQGRYVGSRGWGCGTRALRDCVIQRRAGDYRVLTVTDDDETTPGTCLLVIPPGRRRSSTGVVPCIYKC